MEQFQVLSSPCYMSPIHFPLWKAIGYGTYQECIEQIVRKYLPNQEIVTTTIFIVFQTKLSQISSKHVLPGIPIHFKLTRQYRQLTK